MENPNINSNKINNMRISPKSSLKVRRRKTFLDEQGSNTSKIWKKKESIKNISSSKNKLLYKKKRNISLKKKRSSLLLTLLDFKNIENEIKNIIIEMRRACLWDLMKQNYDINIHDLSNKKKEIKKKKINSKERLSSKYLYNTINEQNIDKEKINFKKSKSINNANIDNIKKNLLNNSDYKNDELKKEKNIFNDINENNEFKSKFDSSKKIKKIYSKRSKTLSKDKFRFLSRNGIVLDSYDENESEQDSEFEGYLINQEVNIFFIYDMIITFAVFYSLLFIPYEIAYSFCLCSINNTIITIVNNLIEVLFFIDLIVNCFIGYYTKEEEIFLKVNLKSIYNYIFGWFFLDFLATLPINLFIFFYCNKYSIQICHTYEKGNNINLILLLKCLKSLKIFKIIKMKKNHFLTLVKEKISNNDFCDNIYYILREILFVFFFIHMISCIYIFIGRHTFPGWIYQNEFQNSSFSNLYMISIYYIITTLTTVGYGDINSNSIVEIAFRLILLAIGIIGYSWLISSISNRINKNNFASINFSNDCQILEKIRISHKKLPYSLYLNIINHLKQKHFSQQKYDKNLLINGLPYFLKNNLIFSMYKTPLEKFYYFKGISNSNFLAEIVSFFSPISAIKDDILLKENDLIEEMYFVREGKLALEISINIDNPEQSINKYLSKEFLNYAFEFESNLNFTQFQKHISLNSIIGVNQNNFKNKKELKISSKNVYLKVHDIHKNEDYGDIFMFFGKRTPFALRVKTKRVKLYSIKKNDFIKLCEQYKNIFKSIHKKKILNFKIIKNIFIKTISTFCNSKGIEINDDYKNTIKKAVNELNKEIIPLDVFRDIKMESDQLNEIDEEINQTIKDFDIELSHFCSCLTLKQKRKIFGNIKKKNTTPNFKNYQIFSIEDLHQISSGLESKYYSSFRKNKKRKNKKKEKKKKIFKNFPFNKVLQNINSDSDESEKTVKLKDIENDSSTTGPKTLNSLPNSLVYSLKRKMQYNKKSHKTESNLELFYLKNKFKLDKNIKNEVNNILNKVKSINKSENLKNSKNFECNKHFSNGKKKNFSLNFKYYNKDRQLDKVNKFNLDKLSSISVDSFEIQKSYKNINQITEGKYLKDKIFQENAIKFINKYYISQYNKNKEKNKESNIEAKKKVYSNQNYKNKDNYLKKSLRTVGSKMSRLLPKKVKFNNNNNPINGINISILNDKSLSTKLRNRSTQKELSINVVIDNYNMESQNNINNNDFTQGKLNLNESIQ